MTIEESKTGVFLGVVLIDALVRLSRDATDSSVSQFVEKHKEKPDAKVGDGELGFFLCPEHWRRGIAMQAIYALMSSLAVTESWCQPDGPILRRVWAETSDNNVAARGLLEKMGLVMRPEYNISGELSPRFHRNGQRVNLVHYAQSDGDQISGSPLAIEQLLRRLEEHQLVRPGWKFRRHKFIG
jgi:GNAT superfamily N-acetyltransferase